MKRVLQSILFLATISCASLESPDRSLVVEAYIFENKPIENIKLNVVNSINNSTSTEQIPNAEVYIQNNGIRQQLVQSSTDGTFSGDPRVLVKSGQVYELLILYNDLEITAQTIVPPTPKKLLANKDTLDRSSSSDFIRTTWNNEDSLWHLGVISNLNPDSKEFPFNNFFSIPTRANQLEISPNNVSIAGDAQFILYGITEEYQKLYRISTSSIGSTNAGNLSNGFGIFAAFSSDTLSIYIKEN